MREAWLDEDGIHTCLANLVSNAIHACTMSDLKHQFEVRLISREENGNIVYEVSDNGSGMDYEISKKIFSSFFSTKGSDTGTGLGLLTTRKIIHQHGGKVSFVTEEGGGSVFRIELPRANLPVPDEEEEPEEDV
jgi:signal transduction histidine kinase